MYKWRCSNGLSNGCKKAQMLLQCAKVAVQFLVLLTEATHSTVAQTQQLWSCGRTLLSPAYRTHVKTFDAPCWETHLQLAQTMPLHGSPAGGGCGHR